MIKALSLVLTWVRQLPDVTPEMPYLTNGGLKGDAENAAVVIEGVVEALRREVDARRAAQIENEALKDRLARSGLEQQRAVRAVQDRVERAYSARAALSVVAKTAMQLGWKVGRGIDAEDPDATWGHVLYVELPDGRQVSWHFAPSDLHLLEGLPAYEGEWDGNFTGRDPSWCLNLLQK